MPPDIDKDGGGRGGNGNGNGNGGVRHPVKDIVLPLTVVLMLLGNALFIGVAWGRITTRMDITERVFTEERDRNRDQDKAIQDLRDRMRDAERDVKEAERRFLMLDDYTRGRVDRLPYRSPPPARW